jgi:3-deoxy-D-manno-octulosonate 8-phosphate phosphatase (KDO 8-P phosphatase)
VHTIMFDFDGVFTDNKVWVDQDGRESIQCDRGDGLAMNILRRFAKEHEWNIDLLILSMEANPVVSARAHKIGVECFQSISNKSVFMTTYLSNKQRSAEGLVYLGNDLNDLAAMKLAGCSVAPSDAHELVKQTADFILAEKGGAGFVRAFVEKLIGLENIEEFFSKSF